jgi:hypothetical protein
MGAVEQLVRFYVEQHNGVIPHSALNGLTPDEVYFGKGEGTPEQLAQARSKARMERLEANRAVAWGA